MNILKRLFGGSDAKPTHSVTDDSGFLAIIDPDAYRGFVHADWTVEMLDGHFKREMQERHLLSWATGLEHFWRIQVLLQQVKTPVFRETIGSIVASRGRLLLTNYESLTMAAAYPHITLPQRHEQKQILLVSTGLHNCRILQLSNPKTNTPFKETVNFVYEITSTTQPAEVWCQIPWRAD